MGYADNSIEINILFFEYPLFQSNITLQYSLIIVRFVIYSTTELSIFTHFLICSSIMKQTHLDPIQECA